MFNVLTYVLKLICYCAYWLEFKRDYESQIDVLKKKLASSFEASRSLFEEQATARAHAAGGAMTPAAARTTKHNNYKQRVAVPLTVSTSLVRHAATANKNNI